MMEENIRGTSQILLLTHEYMTRYKCFDLTNHFNTTEEKLNVFSCTTYQHSRPDVFIPFTRTRQAVD